MRILFVTHYSSLYGANRSLLNLLDGISLFDIEPYVIIPEPGDIEKELERRNIQYEIIPITPWVSNRETNIRRMVSYAISIYRSVKLIDPYIKKWKIQLIYTNSSITPVGRILALINKLPHIWHLREFGKLDFDKYFVFPENISMALIRSSDGIICISESIKKFYFSDNYLKPKTIYNGIASKTDFDKYKEEFKNKGNLYFTFSIIGVIRPSKGQETAIKAISDLTKMGLTTRLNIVGDGDPNYIEYCKKLVFDLGIEKFVNFTGYIKDPYSVLSITDCFLMCSKNEAFGRVTAEAMSACVPVIGNKSGGTTEIITDCIDGYLYTSYEELLEYMSKLVNQPELGQQLGINGWNIAKERFSIETYSQQVYEVIKSIKK